MLEKWSLEVYAKHADAYFQHLPDRKDEGA